MAAPGRRDETRLPRGGDGGGQLAQMGWKGRGHPGD